MYYTAWERYNYTFKMIILCGWLFQSRWTICARVTSKSNVRSWSNSRGEGRLFNVDLIDESVSLLLCTFRSR